MFAHYDSHGLPVTCDKAEAELRDARAELTEMRSCLDREARFAKRMHAERDQAIAELAAYEPAIRSGITLYQHSCGYAEELTAADIAEMNANGGGCDVCEAGDKDGSGWAPLYRKQPLPDIYARRRGPASSGPTPGETEEPPADQASAVPMPDYMVQYEAFWAPIVEPEGVLDRDQVARELSDYSVVMEEASKVYSELAGLSKPNTAAHYILSAAEERYAETYADFLCDRAYAALEDGDEATSELLREIAEEWHAGSWDEHIKHRVTVPVPAEPAPPATGDTQPRLLTASTVRDPHATGALHDCGPIGSCNDDEPDDGPAWSPYPGDTQDDDRCVCGHSLTDRHTRWPAEDVAVCVATLDDGSLCQCVDGKPATPGGTGPDENGEVAA